MRPGYNLIRTWLVPCWQVGDVRFWDLAAEVLVSDGPIRVVLTGRIATLARTALHRGQLTCRDHIVNAVIDVDRS